MSPLATLAARSCRPLRGAEHRISPATAHQRLVELPGWELVEDGQAIRRQFDFSDYYHTMAFVNALAFMAHRQDHHPDLGVHYNRCVVRYSTHDVGGLSDNDFICAAKVSLLAGDTD